ncbi:hypothetical protein [Caenimonas sedimenti]|nr:hypothetical protein [Caenimonas sedimenti]
MASAERTLLALAFAAAVSTGAVAQQVPAPARTAVAPAAASPVPAGRWTLAAVRTSFQQADSNSDGELSRAEAQQLAILPRSFEDLDANKDGVLTPQEYEAGAL